MNKFSRKLVSLGKDAAVTVQKAGHQMEEKLIWKHLKKRRRD